jgi:long-chain acyl-CoA synthetase
MYARARALARGLMSLGVAPGDRVAIVSRTRAEWTQSDIAILLAGATLVPVYETNSPTEARYVLEHSEAKVALCEDPDQIAKLGRAGRPATLEHVVAFQGEPADGVTLDDLMARGDGIEDAELDARRADLAPDDLAALVYTSGTTGPPKGCRLSQRALLVTSGMVIDHLPLRTDSTFYVFLPLAHTLTRMVQLVVLRLGATMSYWSRRMEDVLDDLTVIQPTHLPSVPRVFEKGYARAHATAVEGGPVKAAVFRAASAVGHRAAARRRAGRPLPPALKVAHMAADRVVLSRVREVFGGRVELAVCGGAPVDPAILEFFDACGIPVLEGYGMTETSAVTSLNPLEGRRLGTVGTALPGSEIRVAADGEVLLRGPHLFSGYDGDPAATAEALRDGWLHTGDLGTLDADGYLTLTGRKKEIVVTSSGKNVSPANIELALTGSPWISQAVIHGDRRPYLVALVSLDPVEAVKRAKELGLENDDVTALAADERVQRELSLAVAEVNVHFAPIEQVKRFTILPRELSQADGEVTASLKIKRGYVQQRYADDLERLYGTRRGPSDVWLERLPDGNRSASHGRL